MPLWKMSSWNTHMNRKLNQPSADSPAKPPCVSASALGAKVSTSTWTALEAK